MKLNELIKIDNRFEKSINLLLDLEDPSKIQYYIPTRSSVKILDDYLREVKHYSGNRSTLLIGPYGKGKSHLLLVMMAILSNQETPQMKDLIERISSVNPDTGRLICELIQEEKPILPVIVNASTGNMNQVLLRSLNQALKRAGLSDIAPDTYFSEVLKTVKIWKEVYQNTYQLFINNLETNGYTEETFKKSIEQYDENALSLFRRIYPGLTSGGGFNPSVENEIIQVYQSVNRRLCEVHRYRGIYIIFDEFSKYIEGSAEEYFSKDMKVLQDICELCNSSKEEQMHITCVAHRGIKTYGNALPRSIQNAFKGVEGRLKEVLFVVSSQNNYELIADAIHKKDEFYTWIKGNKPYETVLEHSYRVPAFRTLFTEADFRRIVGEGCYPLTPLSAMLLLSLSEKVAQNERTIFTYLTNKDTNSLAKQLAKPMKRHFIGVDSIYDYFEPQFKEDTQTGIHNEWLKADYAIKKAETEDDQIIVKALAVIRMVNRPDEIPASKRFLKLATGFAEAEFQDSLNRLEQAELIVLKQNLRVYDFKNNVGVNVEQAIQDCAAQYFMKVNVSEELNKVVESRYILPKKHNQSVCMTRYFQFQFMDDDSFMALSSTKYLYENAFSDGKIVLIIPRERIGMEDIARHQEALKDKCLIIFKPEKKNDFTDKIRNLLAVRRLKEDKAFIDDNKVLYTELRNTEKDIISELNKKIEDVYLNRNTVYINGEEVAIGEYGFNRLVSDICDDVYNEAPVINHELINRNEITAQILKARNIILDMILKRSSFEQFIEGTSSEATIYRASILHTQMDCRLQSVRKIIDKFIMGCSGKKVSFSQLIERLINRPIGLRKGLIPIYLAEQLMQLEDMPVVYLNNQELVLDVDVLNNIIKNPEDYFLFVETGTIQKYEYIRDLEVLFAEYTSDDKETDKRNRLLKLTTAMQSWYRSLPQTSVMFVKEDYEGQPIKEIKAFRKLFADSYLNSRDVLFEKIPKIFKEVELNEIADEISKIKGDVDNHIHCLKEEAAEILRAGLRIGKDGDLKQCLLTWYAKLPESSKNSLFNSKAYGIMTYVKDIQTNDTEEIIGRIAKEVTGIFIEDWNDGMQEAFKQELDSIKAEIDAKEKKSNDGSQKLTLISPDGKQKDCYYEFDPENISNIGYYFRNSIEDVMDEFGTSVETSEKVGILVYMIEQLLK